MPSSATSDLCASGQATINRRLNRWDILHLIGLTTMVTCVVLYLRISTFVSVGLQASGRGLPCVLGTLSGAA